MQTFSQQFIISLRTLDVKAMEFHNIKIKYKINQAFMEKKQSSQFSICLLRSDHQNNGQKEQEAQIKKQHFDFNQKSKPKEKLNSGHWTPSENARYLVFIMHYRDVFKQDNRRKIWRIFKEMSKFIETRNYIQCRSHHQKMIEQYESIQKYVQLKASTYSPRIISKIKAELFQIRDKPKDKSADIEDRQADRQPPCRGIQQSSEKIQVKIALENLAPPLVFISPYGFPCYQSFHPFMPSYPHTSFNYPFFWGHPQ